MSFMKYVTPSTYWELAIHAMRQSFPNLIVDRLVRSLHWEELTQNIGNCNFTKLQLSSQKLQEWATEYYPDWPETFGNLRHKKLIEFYLTFEILNPRKHHVFMDAAGGVNGYLTKIDCESKILQDLRISDSTRRKLGPSVNYVEGDSRSIPLPDKSVDRISCHHSFEHFQGGSDINFIKEVQRLLAIGGKCCIVPLFFANRYAEITDTISLKFKFDQGSLRIIDPTATIPGKKFSGHYARVYDIPAFQRRIMQNIDLSRFAVTVFSVEIDGGLVPDMSLECHKIVTSVNFPYRALVIERVSE